jgi:NodT family efflux transporter outer membrane factor (OMF) lipoprotein
MARRAARPLEAAVRPAGGAVLRTLLVAIGAGTLGGCLFFKPSPGHDEVVRQALPETTTVPPEWSAARRAEEPVADDWLATFQDPELEALVRQAMANNPDLAAAAARVERAQQVVRKVGAQMLPSVGARVSTSATLDFDGKAPFGAIGAVLGVAWEADIWGKLASQKEAAAAGASATALDYAFAAQSLAAATATSWYAGTETFQLLRLSRVAADLYRQLVVLVEAKAAAGQVGQLEVAEARARLFEAETQVIRAEGLFAEARRNLEVLVGRYPAAAIEVRREFVPIPPPVPAGLPATLLERRPDLLASWRRVQAAFQGLQASRLALLPSLGLTVAGGSLDDRVLSILKLNPNFLTIGAGLLAPIFEGGALRAQVQIASAQQREAVALLGRAALDAFKEVEAALTNEQLLAGALHSLEKAEAARTEATRIARDKFAAGAIDLLPVLQLQAAQLAVQADLIRVRNARLQNRIQLHLALGGGWDQGPAAGAVAPSATPSATPSANPPVTPAAAPAG